MFAFRFPRKLFGEEPVESADEGLPADPAEWLASLGAASDESEDE